MASEISEVSRAIERGLLFLQDRQKPSGEIGCQLVRLREDAPPLDDPSPFPAAVLALCLASCDSPVATAIINRACAYARRHMEPFGAWRYWPMTRTDCGMLLPDLDDTATISLALRRNGIKIPDNRGLILGNRNKRGRFYTWIYPRFIFSPSLAYWWVALGRWRKPNRGRPIWAGEAQADDIDAIVNANVLAYLGDLPEAKAVCDYLIGVFREQKEDTCDRWYQNRYVYYCAVARNYHEGQTAFGVIREEMINRIDQGRASTGKIGSGLLDTAHGLAALLYLGSASSELRSSLACLISEQGADGGWPYAPYYYSGNMKTFAFGSTELSTALCLQALSLAARASLSPATTVTSS